MTFYNLVTSYTIIAPLLNMEPDRPSNYIFCTSATPLFFSQNQGKIAVAQQNQTVAFIDQELRLTSIFKTNLTDKVWSIKMKDNVLVRGSCEGSVTLWDIREASPGKPLHTFNKPGYKMNTLDVSQHILAAGTSKGVTFWDLRRMKQRCEFNDSFNEQVTCLQFSYDVPTVFHACSLDGLIAEFDLKEQSEEDAFSWGHQIIESPSRLQYIGSTTLIQTQNHILLTLELQDQKEKLIVNNVENPTHVLHSYLGNGSKIHYYTKTMKTNAIQYWIGNYNVGYLPSKIDIEMLIPVKDAAAIYADQKGNWFYDKVLKGVASRHLTQNQDFMTVQQLEAKMTKKPQEKVMNQNGFILSKPSTLKNHSKKFKPY